MLVILVVILAGVFIAGKPSVDNISGSKISDEAIYEGRYDYNKHATMQSLSLVLI